MVFRAAVRDVSVFPTDLISLRLVRAAVPIVTRTTVFKEGTRLLMAAASIDDVQPRAQTALASSPIFELRDLQVEHCDGMLLISGVVSSFYHKQLAQEAVRSVCEDIEVINSIRVE